MIFLLSCAVRKGNTDQNGNKRVNLWAQMSGWGAEKRRLD